MFRTTPPKLIKKAQGIVCVILVHIYILSLCFIPSNSYAQSVLDLPEPGTMVRTSEGFTPTYVKGLILYPENPLKFDFIVDSGDENIEGDALKDTTTTLIKYFLASLTIPEPEMWVNLSPYEEDRIIPDGFGLTEMGRDMLAQDYILKQLTASMIYPEEKVGEAFWERVHAKAMEMYGTNEMPINTFNKIWIVPGEATVYENQLGAFVVESSLKVLLEEDYIALQKNIGNEEFATELLEKAEVEKISKASSNIIKDVLIPEIEREINQGKNFAKLRQIYQSMILATWYKINLEESLLGRIYVDENKTKGIEVEDRLINRKIYDQYVTAFKKGVYDYLRVDYDVSSRQIIPRKYFSGGGIMDGLEKKVKSRIIRGPIQQLPASAQLSVTEAKGEQFKVTWEAMDAEFVNFAGGQAQAAENVISFEQLRQRRETLDQFAVPVSDAALTVDWQLAGLDQAEQVIAQQGVDAGPFTVIANEPSVTSPRREVPQPVYVLGEGDEQKRFILKPFEFVETDDNREDVRDFLARKRPGANPTFFDSNRANEYLELHLGDYGYYTLEELREALKASGSWEAYEDDIRQKVVEAAEQTFRQDEDVVYFHGHLFDQNIMLQVDSDVNVLDVKFIDWKLLKKHNLTDFYANSPDITSFIEAKRANQPFSLEGKQLNNIAFERSDWLKGENLKKAAMLGARMIGADLSNAQAQEANISGSRFVHGNLKGIQLQNAQVRQVDFEGASLDNANFEGAKVSIGDTGITLDGAIPETSFIGARLKGANFQNTNLSFVRFNSADLQGADLRGTTFDQSFLDLIDDYFQDANLEGVRVDADSPLAAFTSRGVIVEGAVVAVDDDFIQKGYNEDILQHPFVADIASEAGAFEELRIANAVRAIRTVVDTVVPLTAEQARDILISALDDVSEFSQEAGEVINEESSFDLISGVIREKVTVGESVPIEQAPETINGWIRDLFTAPDSGEIDEVIVIGGEDFAELATLTPPESIQSIQRELSQLGFRTSPGGKYFENRPDVARGALELLEREGKEILLDRNTGDVFEVPEQPQAKPIKISMRQLRSDQATVGVIKQPDTYGGIDFNPEILDLTIKRDETGVPLPIEQQDIYNMQVDGFYPVILNITPGVSLPLILSEIEPLPGAPLAQL